MKGMKYGYARVSTNDQDAVVQEQQLRELIAQRGWTLQRIYSDRSSGAKERRPGLDTLTLDARRGAFDVVMVWRFETLSVDASGAVRLLKLS